MFTEFWQAAWWVALASIPVVFCALAFLHAARVPQWAWVLSDHTQIWWLAGLLLSVVLIPFGLVPATWYLVKIRPQLERIETGNLAEPGER